MENPNTYTGSGETINVRTHGSPIPRLCPGHAVTAINPTILACNIAHWTEELDAINFQKLLKQQEVNSLEDKMTPIRIHLRELRLQLDRSIVKSGGWEWGV